MLCRLPYIFSLGTVPYRTVPSYGYRTLVQIEKKRHGSVTLLSTIVKMTMTRLSARIRNFFESLIGILKKRIPVPYITVQEEPNAGRTRNRNGTVSVYVFFALILQKKTGWSSDTLLYRYRYIVSSILRGRLRTVPYLYF